MMLPLELDLPYYRREQDAHSPVRVFTAGGIHATETARKISFPLISWALERHRPKPKAGNLTKISLGFSPAPAMLICCGPGHRGDGGIEPAAPPFAGCRRTVLNSPDRLARVPRRNMPRDQLHGEANSARTSRISAIPPPQCKSLPLLARAL